MRQVRAILLERTGGPEVMKLGTIEVGEPGPGEVRIRHHASGLNYIDTYHRSGLYPLPLPAVLGGEAAGVVEATGAGVAHIAVGDRVAYVAKTPGTYSDARVVPALTASATRPDPFHRSASASSRQRARSTSRDRRCLPI